VLIVGLGSSGLAAALLAARDGSEVWVTDQRGDAELAPTLARLPDGCRRFLGGHPNAAFDAVELVVTSPGVPASSPVLAAARSRGIAVVAELEFAWQHCRSLPLVAVTGSNGKSTVTVLVAEMLKASGVEVVAGGNLGTPASDLVLKGGWSAWVLEVSSFQAEVLTAMRPRVGVFLNLSQDHRRRHRASTRIWPRSGRLLPSSVGRRGGAARRRPPGHRDPRAPAELRSRAGPTAVSGLVVDAG
jgi:UDP-N-acetylmuramoylalanine--D-glutamate ligase